MSWGGIWFQGRLCWLLSPQRRSFRTSWSKWCHEDEHQRRNSHLGPNLPFWLIWWESTFPVASYGYLFSSILIFVHLYSTPTNGRCRFAFLTKEWIVWSDYRFRLQVKVKTFPVHQSSSHHLLSSDYRGSNELKEVKSGCSLLSTILKSGGINGNENSSNEYKFFNPV